MPREDFEREVLQRLSRIESRQDACTERHECLRDTERTAREALQSAKSAHHRIDNMSDDRKELKEDLTAVITQEVGSVYRSAKVLAFCVSLAVSGGIALLAAWIRR